MKNMRYRILPYKQGSRSARALANALEGKVLRLNASRFRQTPLDMVINWGWSGETALNVLNPPEATRLVSNKLTFFTSITSPYLPKHWTNKEDIPNEAFPIVCRTILTGHSGAGIHIAARREDLVDARLYVQYVKKKDEYRVHMGTDGTISVQKKARRLSHENPNWQVRNLTGGFIYKREDITLPQVVKDAADDVFFKTSLDFGAVDVIYNSHEGKAYVLEINTAPGLEGRTVQDYANYFKGLYNE